MLYHGPPAAPGQSIGLLGGSFDPPHQGHVHITETALRTLRLDRVWWLVSPGNPLKPTGPAEIERRMAASRALMRRPRVEITDIESRLGVRYTADTLEALRRLYPRQRFVWLMGADNLANFHRWDQWRRIAESTPFAVLARPGAQLSAGLSPAARALARWRVDQHDAKRLPYLDPPAWTLVYGPMSPASSTAIRVRGGWP